MLIAQSLGAEMPRLEKWIAGKEQSDKNAFPHGTCVELCIKAERKWGFSAVVLRLQTEDGAARDIAFSFAGCEGGCDSYTLTLHTAELCPTQGGLVFYELLFLRGADTLFSDTPDNSSLYLSERSARRFRLLLHKREFSTPTRFHGRVMYHIFVDRFAPRGGKRRADAVYRAWGEEITQFATHPGGAVANNEFFGGTLWGVADRLDYLALLGVGAIYLSPIHRAYSNHKYDVGDYEAVDEQFGGRTALKALIAACKKRDILLILDGVFNHTGDDSKYFNKRKTYPVIGAFQSKESPYYTWYHFAEHPEPYAAWWGIPILPKLNLENPEVEEYLLGERGIVARYTEMGIDGWRLDVADELSNRFLERLRALVKAKTGGNGVILGEVWENAADKIAYGKRRRYFLGDQLDGVMNYPLREALIAFVRDGNAVQLVYTLRELWSSYPTAVCHSLMNLLSTHDTARILTVFRGEENIADAKEKLCMAALLQYTVYGVPSLFYGDEAGLLGQGDPFCRRPFPWGQEDTELLDFYRKLGSIRRENPVLAEGDFRILSHTQHALCYERRNEKGHLIVAANRGTEPFAVCLPHPATELLTETQNSGIIFLSPNTAAIWRIEDVQKGMGKVDEKQKSRKQALSL